jgi:hypothetical protein
MNPSRWLFLLVLFLGICSATTFHSSGAVDEQDALTASALRQGVAGSPPLGLTSRVHALGVDLIRLVYAPTGLFRAMHLTGGLLLALAAALSTIVAYRVAGDHPPARLAAGLLVGAATLFGANLAGLAMKGDPLAVTITLLAATAVAWTAPVPWAFVGGTLLGLATSEHPWVVFLLPGFIALALRAATRAPETRFLPRAGLGFAVGLTALLLPMLDSWGHPLLDFGDPETPGRAVAVWWGAPSEPFWRIASPQRWAAGFVEVALSVWRTAGPLGLLVGAVGLASLLRPLSSAVRSLLPAAVPALALIFGEPRDPMFAAALLGWFFLFLVPPGMVAVARRLPLPSGAARGLPGVGLAAGALLLLMNWGTINRSAEKGVQWARDSFGALPQDALLLTGNPVHLALASDGERPDLDVVYVGERSTLAARRTGREVHAPPLRAGERIGGEFLQEVVGLNQGIRPVMLEPALFFDMETRSALLGSRWSAQPHGLAFRVLPLEVAKDPNTDEELQRGIELWGAYELMPGTPPSPLRDELDGNAFYGRSLLQSAALFLELGRLRDAEREFLFALTLQDANQTLAAFGLSRVLYEDKHFDEAIAILERFVSDSDAGAWTAYRLQGTAHFRMGRYEEGLPILEHALRLTPANLVQEREDMRLLIEGIQTRLRATPRAG